MLNFHLFKVHSTYNLEKITELWIVELKQDFTVGFMANAIIKNRHLALHYSKVVNISNGLFQHYS